MDGGQCISYACVASVTVLSVYSQVHEKIKVGKERFRLQNAAV